MEELERIDFNNMKYHLCGIFTLPGTCDPSVVEEHGSVHFHEVMKHAPTRYYTLLYSGHKLRIANEKTL